MSIRLELLKSEFEEEFILMNQKAFKYGAEQYLTEAEMEKDYEEEGEIISRKTIVNSIHQKGSFPYQIMQEDKMVGGIIVNINGQDGDLELFFIDPSSHSKGIGQEAWRQIEKIHSNVKVWVAMTPCFEKRNIHFYVNKLGFHIVKYYNEHYSGSDMTPNMLDMYIFEKKM